MKLSEVLSQVLKGKSILIVDDEEKIRDLIASYLKKVKVSSENLVSASDGAEAIRKINNQSFDLIIVDIVLPRKNGLEVFQELRSKAKTKNIPVLIISGNLDSSIAKRAIFMGAKHILTKPFKYGLFMERLSLCLKNEMELFRTKP